LEPKGQRIGDVFVPQPRRIEAAIVALAAALTEACGGQAPARNGEAAHPAATPSAPAAPSRAAEKIEDARREAPAPPTQARNAAPEEPKVTFPPLDFNPPFARSAKPGDGKWVALGDAAAGDFAAEKPSLLFRAVVHPHPVSRFVSVTVVAVDLTRAAVHLVAGTEDPVAPQLPKSERTGLVPDDHQASLLAVFNGGYQTAHGRWGMKVGSTIFVPARDIGCTVGLYRDGSARIGTWPALAATESQMTAFRQTPPCLVENGELHVDLQARREGAWGGRVPNVTTRNRSAVGVDRTGRVLFYAFGDEAGPSLLAEGMRSAGAFAAAQLDINYYWTRFLLFGKKKPGGALQVTSPLAPKMQYSATGYVTRPAHRDFFYVRRR
jgi:hypothetical protein